MKVRPSGVPDCAQKLKGGMENEVDSEGWGRWSWDQSQLGAALAT